MLSLAFVNPVRDLSSVEIMQDNDFQHAVGMQLLM